MTELSIDFGNEVPTHSIKNFYLDEDGDLCYLAYLEINEEAYFAMVCLGAGYVQGPILPVACDKRAIAQEYFDKLSGAHQYTYLSSIHMKCDK